MGQARGWVDVVGVIAIVWLASCSSYRAQQVTYFPDGSIRWAAHLEAGRYHGEMKRWHANGKLAVQGNYSHGKKHGVFRFYDQQGALTKQQVFASDNLQWSGDSTSSVPSIYASVGEAPKTSVAEQTPRATTFVTMPQDPMESAVLLQTGYHSQDRTTLSTDLKLLYRKDKWIALAMMSRSSVDDNLGPSGAKTSASVGGGYTFYDSGGYSFSVTAKLSLPVAGDDIGGFAASSRSIHHQLSESATAEPNSSWMQAMASLRRTKGTRTLRLDMGITPMTAIRKTLPAPAGSQQLMGYMGAAVGLAMKGYNFSVELSGSSKLLGSMEETPIALSAGVGVQFDTKIVQPSISLVSPLDSYFGETLIILLSLRRPWKGNTHD